MANGRQGIEEGFCNYRYSDLTYCKEKIVQDYTTFNGLKNKRKWEDKDNQNHCMFHANNSEKENVFHEMIRNRIESSENSLKKRLSEKEQGLFSNEEKRQREEKIRSESIIDFEGYYFPGNVIFKDHTFINRIRFEAAQFEKIADFKRAIFEDNVNFDNVKFLGLNDFSYTVFQGEASFFMTFFTSAFFSPFSIFEKKAIFYKAFFDRGLNFWRANFLGPVSFYNIEVLDIKIAKDKAEKVNFNDVIFNDTVDFSKAAFHNDFIFKDVVCKSSVNFNRAIFHKNAFYRNSTFLDNLTFSHSAFLGNIFKFSENIIEENRTIFNNTVFNCEVLFHDQMLKGVRFTGCYLGGTSFYGSDVRDAVFINSSWNRKYLERQIEKLIIREGFANQISVMEISKIYSHRNRGAVLLDEFIFYYSKNSSDIEKRKKWIFFGYICSYRGIKSYLINIFKRQKQTFFPCHSIDPTKLELEPLYLEHLYCQFKLAMDRNKMYGLANDFYFGEKLMETKRLREEHSYLKWAFLWLYRLLAGFGNSPWKAIFSLIIILFASSFLLIKFNGLNAEKPKEAYERCPCERNEIKPAAAIKQNLKTPTASTKAGKSYISTLLYNSLAPFNAFNQSVKPPQSAKAPVKVPKKKEAVYSLKDDYWCNTFYVSLWNLTASPGRKSGDFKENGMLASLAVFIIQYIFRPLMVALIIISVRRKVYRG